ncbi:hypothetical protein LCGC14_2321280, partial [marine sediment metagenome]
MYPGIPGAGGKVSFAAKPAFTHAEYKMIGRTGWFDYSPYAWNFSGKCKPGGDRIEIIAVSDDPANKGKTFSKRLSNLELFVLDRKAKTVTRKGLIWANQAAYTRLSIGDLNGDGRMDVLCTGGVFTRGAGTNIW